MKLSEMARKAKEKLSGVFGRNRKEENSQETAEMDAQKAQEGQQDAKTGISSQNNEKKQETANNEATAQLEAAILAANEALEKTFREFGKEAANVLTSLLKELSKTGKTEAQIRKEELWKRYYWEKAKMSNNERRRRGIPMVRRPKRQQYRTKKRKVKALSGDTKSIDGFCPYLGIVDECHAHEEESGQQDDGK